MTSKDWSGNINSVWKTLGASNHTDNEREADDYYATDPIAIDKLLEVEKPHRFIWECACGGGHLSERLTERSYDVFNSDIKNRGYAKQHLVLDFLKQEDKLFSFEHDILTNPPYKYATEFVLKALELLHEGCKCYMFLKLTFLEGKRRYIELFKDTPPPQRLCLFRARPLRQKRGVRPYAGGWRLRRRVCVVCLAERLCGRNRGAVDIGGRYESHYLQGQRDKENRERRRR